MKRLYYITQDLDDAEVISDEVHQNGIDDHHFFVISRDESGLKTHHLHGSNQLEDTNILAARKRAYLLGGSVLGLGVILLTLFSDVFGSFMMLPLVLLIAIALVTIGLVKVAGNSFDGYFMGLFNQHLDRGEVVIVIDVSRDQASKVEAILDTHPKAHFIADCSSFRSAIPD
ncbi:hypothetical protein [Thaumasiovibrio subtropicus]|uniref:hypothetical protein n=1 Tax=Thaumasiovibrio subtropicus TaxID=1891207 RepID=UPI000B355BF7|nr:hypothetical protein [Thaumasiovibrio subtropicus]